VPAYQTKSYFILFLCCHFVTKKHASIILKNGNKQICGKKKLTYETNQTPTQHQINTSTIYYIKKIVHQMIL
jgi:hypothetical protein